ARIWRWGWSFDSSHCADGSGGFASDQEAVGMWGGDGVDDTHSGVHELPLWWGVGIKVCPEDVFSGGPVQVISGVLPRALFGIAEVGVLPRLVERFAHRPVNLVGCGDEGFS